MTRTWYCRYGDTSIVINGYTEREISRMRPELVAFVQSVEAMPAQDRPTPAQVQYAANGIVSEHQMRQIHSGRVRRWYRRWVDLETTFRPLRAWRNEHREKSTP